MLKQTLNDVKLWLVLSLTLGLAPFFPEPHLWGKLKWVFGDPSGMQTADYLDLLMHGFPWIMLIRALTLMIKNKLGPSTLS